MKTVCKKLLSLMLVAVLLVSVVPFQAFAAEVTDAPATETTTATEPTETTAAATEPVAQASVEEETTAPETTAATEAPTVDQNVAQQPAVSAINDEAYIYYVLEGAEGVADSGDEIISTVKTKIGAKVSGVPGAGAILDRYAKVFGSSAGKQFDHWELNGEYVNPNSLYVTDENSGGALYLYAVVTDKPQTITLNANGGTISTGNKHSVYIGENYGNVAPLPTANEVTRKHYTFAGWYWKNSNNIEVEVTDDSIVYDAKELKAHWILNEYTVTYQKFGDSWEDVKTVSVDANSTVNAAKGTFPTDAEIAADFAIAGYSIVGWEIGYSDVAFKAGSTKITDNMIVRPRYQRTVTLEARNPVTDVSYSRKSITVEIGEPFGAIEKTLPNPGARDTFTFFGWEVGQDVIKVDQLSNSASHPLYYPSLGTTFYARWTESKTVYLYIHVDRNTTSAAKVVPYYQAPAKGVFDLTQINMYSVFPSYGDYDDTVDSAYGWYTPDQWERYCTGKSADAAMYYEDIAEKGYGEFHIMLINGGTSSSNSSSNGNSYNNNSSTADKTNPTTGDQIFMAVTVMAMSASALALFFFLKKRKAC